MSKPTRKKPEPVLEQADSVVTKTYSDGTEVTGKPPLPDLSPAQQDAQATESVQVDVRTLERARALPELENTPPLDEIEFASTSVQHFKDHDRRTMEIVSSGGELWKRAVS